MQAMTASSTPPPPPTDTGVRYPEKPRMPGGGYWLLITAGLLVGSLLAAWWASSIPPVPIGHAVCADHPSRLASVLVKVGVWTAVAAGVSAAAGLFGAWGWRWFFVPLLVGSPILVLIAGFSTFSIPPGCPGPFS